MSHTELAPRAPREEIELTERTVAFLLDAFADDPVLAWLFPDRLGRARAATRLLGHFTRRSIAAGELQLAGDGAATAVWVPIGPPSRAPGADDAGGASSGELPEEFAPYVDRLATFDRLLDRPRLTETPHLYLAFMAVDERHRGRGFGSAMLRDRLSRADTDGSPAYLEASSERSRVFYERHGFADLGVPVTLPDGPPVWPMWREPGRPPTT